MIGPDAGSALAEPLQLFPIENRNSKVENPPSLTDILHVSAILPTSTVIPPMAAAPGTVPLTPQQIEAIRQARKHLTKIRRTCTYALFDGWTLVSLAALTILGGLLSVSGWIVGTPMLIIALIELRAAARLRQLDPRAPRILGLNQLALAALLIAYALWGLHGALSAPNPYASYLKDYPDLKGTLGPLGDFTRHLLVGMYGGLIAIAIFVQGSTAFYYFTRLSALKAYLAETPSWIIQLQKAGMSP